MPGLDKSRVVGTSDQDLDEFTCAICLALFVCPEVTQCCRQTYCKDCIREWVSQHKTCPNDRKTLTKRGLRPVPRAMTNFLDNIKIKCDYKSDGCTQVVRIGDLCQHRIVCDFRPNQLCKTCGLIKESGLSHNFIESLKLEKERTEAKYLNLSEENSFLVFERQENSEIISALKTELIDVKNVHQITINQIKNEQSIALDQLTNSYNLELQIERESHQVELESVKHSLRSKGIVVSDLESKLKTLQQDYCSAKKDNEELRRQLKSTEKAIPAFKTEIVQIRNSQQMTINRIKNEQSKQLDQLTKSYNQALQMENERIGKNQKELETVEQQLQIAKNVVSDLKRKLCTSESNYHSANDKLRQQFQATKDLQKELTEAKINHKITIEIVEKSLIKEETAKFDLESELDRSRSNYNLAKEDISELKRQLLTANNNNILIILILSVFALFLGLTIYVARTI